VDAGAKSGKQTKLHPQLTEPPVTMVIEHSMTQLITKAKYVLMRRVLLFTRPKWRVSGTSEIQ